MFVLASCSNNDDNNPSKEPSVLVKKSNNTDGTVSYDEVRGIFLTGVEENMVLRENLLLKMAI